MTYQVKFAGGCGATVHLKPTVQYEGGKVAHFTGSTDIIVIHALDTMTVFFICNIKAWEASIQPVVYTFPIVKLVFDCPLKLTFMRFLTREAFKGH